MKKVLVTNVEVVQYSGAEINCITIAKRFKEKGYEVYIGALDFGEPLINEIKDLGFNFIDLLEKQFDFSKVEFDIVWAQHSFLLDWLIFDKKVQTKKIITSCLSPKEIFECPPLYANSMNMILANSMETKDAIEKEGAKNVQLFENYSFENYFERDIKVKQLKNIAVVSNHIPEEEKEAVQLLKDKGYNVDVYGLEGKQVYITDEVLINYDAIITIGKTVQYAMSLAIPVYIYDVHGGPGYLKMENIEKSREKNFSGRGYGKKTSTQIYEEIEKEFGDTLKEQDKIKHYAYENFCFEKIFDNIIEKVKLTQDIDLEQIKQDYSNYSRNIMVSRRVAEYVINKYDKIINRRNADVKYLQGELKKRDDKILEIENSKPYKKIRKIFTRGDK